MSGAKEDKIGVLVMAYGGPDSLEDVEPYLQDVRGGRPTSPEIVDELRERYRRIGGRSPILERTRAQAARLQKALDTQETAPAYRCYVGMRHWAPRIDAALLQMSRDGISHAVGLVMAPHYSRLSVGAYFEKVEAGNGSVEVAPIERWHTMPEFLETSADFITACLQDFPSAQRHAIQLLFTAHSLPERILEWNDPYPRELNETTEAVVHLLRSPERGIGNSYEFAYQSAAMTSDPWLGPDAGGAIRRLHDEGCPGALIVPIGFTSDHVEVLYDIDIEYANLAEDIGFLLRRIPMLNDDPNTMTGLAGLVRKCAADRGWVN